LKLRRASSLHCIDRIGFKESKLHIWLIIVGLLFILITVAFYFYQQESISMLDILLFLPSVVFTLLIHEVIHAVLFLLLGKGHAKIKLCYQNRALIVQQLNPALFFTRWEMNVVLIIPFLLLSGIFLIGMDFAPTYFLATGLLLVNGLGSSIDIYIMGRLFRSPAHTLIGFDPVYPLLFLYSEA
jgi:hypothetical protein